MTNTCVSMNFCQLIAAPGKNGTFSKLGGEEYLVV